MPDDVPLSRVLAALERAARYRRSLAPPEHANPVALTNAITANPGRPEVRFDREGWAPIGSVVDGIVGCWPLTVWWHAASDRVRVERPPDVGPPPEPARALFPSHPPMGGTNGGMLPPFIAMKDYIFTFEGLDYSPEETERLTAAQDSIDGWTWRRDA